MSYTLKELAERIDGEVIGDETVIVTGINSLQEARDDELSFFTDRRYRDRITKTRAAALITSEVIKEFTGPLLLVSNPNLAYARVTCLFAQPLPRFSGISNQAFVHETSQVGENVTIFPLAYSPTSSSVGW